MSLSKGLTGPLVLGLTSSAANSESALLDAWRFAEWEAAVWNRVDRDYYANAPILRGTQIYIDQDPAGDATGGGGAGTSGDPYLCDTWDDVCDLLMVTLTLADDTAIIFRDGDYYEGTHQFDIDTSHLTVCTRDQYAAALLGAIKPTATQRVFVNHFTIKIPAASSWTNTATDTYYFQFGAADPTLYQIRKQTERLTDGEMFRNMTSIANLATLSGTQRGFFYDTANDRAYIKVTAGEDPADFAWELVDGEAHASNAADRRATFSVLNNTTGVRITGVRSDGFGYTAAASGQYYGIKTLVGGDRFVVVNDVECYFNNRHNLGCNENNGTGGVTVYEDCFVGFCFDPSATMHVHYNAPGGQTAYVRNMTCVAGSIPTNNSTSRARGRGAFCHTDGVGTNLVNKAYFFDLIAKEHEFGIAELGYVNDNVDTSVVLLRTDLRLSQCNVYMVRFLDERYAIGSTSTAINQNMRGAVNIGHRLFSRPAAGSNSANFASAAPRSTYAINCVQSFDMQDYTTGTFGMYNGGGANSSLPKGSQFYNCYIENLNLVSGVIFCFFERSNTSSSSPPSTLFLYETRNCTLAEIGGAGTSYASHGNNVGQNSNNAYWGVTQGLNQNRGYNNVANFVELSAAPWLDTIPQSGDQIFQAGNRPPKAREDREGFRFPSPPDIATRSSLAAYSPNSVRFDGTNDGLTASVGGSVVDGSTLILAFKVIPKNISATQRVFGTRNGRIFTRFDSFGGVFFTAALETSSAATLAGGTTGVNIVNADVPYIFLLTADTSALAVDPHFRCVYKQIGTTGAWTTGFNSGLDSTGNIDFTDAQFLIGQANGGGERLNACIGDLYVGQGSGNALDTALQAKFLDANGLPVQLGQHGERVTGTAPLIFLRNGFETFQNNNSNLGLQGNFTVTGTLAEGESFV